MQPRQAAEQIVQAMEEAAAAKWNELEGRFPEEHRELFRSLVWEHVTSRFTISERSGSKVRQSKS